MIMITANVHLKAFYHGHIERMKKKTLIKIISIFFHKIDVVKV